jgi:hypothetical protein
MQAQLGKQMTDVGLHAAFGEVGLLTDLEVRHSVRDQHEHGEFAFGDVGGRR